MITSDDTKKSITDGPAMIMVQGTCSNAGKSLLAAALCRIFARDGYRTVPFKSWNMSLNSTVTPGGGEIGIAQAIQAQAAGVSPTVDMQPLLIKPTGKGETQVVARGRPVAKNDLERGQEYVNWAVSVIEESLNNLKKENDIIVMEGAGSPVEVNVKDRDLANMRVALLNQTPVLLVADIDRGGALAALVGTWRLLPPGEKELLAGFVLNKFRGDAGILQPGLEFLEKYTEIPVAGVVPYLRDIKIPEEDSVSLQKHNRSIIDRGQDQKDQKNQEKIIICIIKLPHISNFTDFTGLELEIDVKLNYVVQAEELTAADLIIIPGTKNTIGDLQQLQKSGLALRIKEMVRDGTPLIGICGGYQMLGKKLLNPELVESKTRELKGLNLLPAVTTFSSGKNTCQVKAKIRDNGDFYRGLAGTTITGYEIHMGETRFLKKLSFPHKIIERSGDKADYTEGAVSRDGLIMGTYLHGLFNNDRLRRNLVNFLKKRKGLAVDSGSGYCYNSQLEGDYDKLADAVYDNLDMKYIYDLIFRGQCRRQRGEMK